MKFFCEYCGYRIDADKDSKCPNCGASYKKNETYKRLEKEREDAKAQIVEQQKESLKFFNRTSKLTKISIIIIFLIAITIIITVGFTMGREIRSDLNSSQTTSEEKQPEKVTVGINEFGKAEDYQVKVTGYETATYSYKTAKEGYEFVTFHLAVENLTSETISNKDVNCIVDGIAQTNATISGYSTIPFAISSELIVKGDATFEVPINATSYDIRYGDYVTIHIEK